MEGESLNHLVARQPIFGSGMKVFAYELLYRADRDRNCAGELDDPDRASSTTIVASFHSIGIERLTGGKRAFVNFTERLLLSGTATLFPRETLVVEVLESVSPTKDVIDACHRLKERGYMLALDDFVLREEMRPLLSLADVIKVDWRAACPAEIRDMIAALKPCSAMLLAEKIETKEEYELAVSMGFSLFQGFFFCKPTILAKKKVEPLISNYMQLIHAAYRDEIELKDLAHIIRRDAILTYRLLRLVNSAYFGMQYEVTDIMSALAILGINETRKWISLLAMMGICRDKPDELVRVSMIRGRVLELYGMKFLSSSDVHDYFMIGLFSLLDIILDNSMEEVMRELSVPALVSRTLTYGQGEAADLLRLMDDFEHGKWDDARKHCGKLRLSIDGISALYVDALLWCGDFSI